MVNRNVICVIDGAAGSCGKAKVIGELVTDPNINIRASVTNCMPNAGHTFVDEKGHATIFRNIPVSSVNPNIELFIGPGSAIDMDVFIEEYAQVKKYLGDRKIYVHEMVPLIVERHKKYEREHIKSGSTFKGCGAVTQEKVIRDKKLEFFKTYKNAIACSNDEWLERLYSHLDKNDEYVMLEGAQGCDLDLNHSGNYPFVTSRNVSTSQLLADSGISPERLLQTIMVIRPFPIRISNVTKDGAYMFTGSYGTGAELTWSEVNLASQNGVYPFRNNCPREIYYEFAYHAKSILDESINEIIEMYNMLPVIYKIQLLNGVERETLEKNEINLILALEIERIYHKIKGERAYKSIVIKRINNNGRVFESPDYIITDLSEMTSVTKKERRIFDLDIYKLKNNVRINNPHGLYLNFFQQFDYGLFEKQGNYEDIKNKYLVNYDNIDRYIEWLESETNTSVLSLGTGAKNGEVIKRLEMIKK
ncbi:MAG: adenylosuccinate synthetase [Erysipelotrichales bacterium]|nr:adenylosuccinate synthetase [Erysipelotrichales bacterium]